MSTHQVPPPPQGRLGGLSRGTPSMAAAGHVLDPETLGDHIDRLFRAAWALCRSREDAEDLVQDTYARVLARSRLLRQDDDLGYLLRVMRNTFISGRRAAARRPQLAAQDPEALNLPESQADTAGSQAREVIGAIRALPAEFRDALVAVDVAGLSYSEAAKALRVRQSTIGSRLFRARNELAERLTTTTASRSTTAGYTPPTRTASRHPHARRPPEVGWRIEAVSDQEHGKTRSRRKRRARRLPA